MAPLTMAPLTQPSPSPTPPAVQEDIEAAIAAIVQRARLLPPGTGALLPLPLYAALPAAKQMAALRPAPAGVRNQVLLYLWCPEVVAFAINARQPAGCSTAQLSDAQWPVDAVALAMLMATAKNMNQENSKSAGFDTVCAEHTLSAVALSTFIEELQPILKAATVAPELSEALY